MTLDTTYGLGRDDYYDLFPATRVQPTTPTPKPGRRPYRYQLTCFCGRSISLRAAENATKKCRCGARASRRDGRISIEGAA